MYINLMVSFEGVLGDQIDAAEVQRRSADYLHAMEQTLMNEYWVNLSPDLRAALHLPRMRVSIYINDMGETVQGQRVIGFIDASVVILGAGVKEGVRANYREFLGAITEATENIERILPMELDIEPDDWVEYPDFTAEYIDPLEVPRQRQQRANTEARIMRRTLEGIRELPPEIGREIAGFAAGERTIEQPYYRTSRIPLSLRNEALLIPHEVRAARASAARKNVEVRGAEVPEPAARAPRTWKNYICGLGKTRKNCQKNMNAWMAGPPAGGRRRRGKKTRRRS
jgi:hypothetical protein